MVKKSSKQKHIEEVPEVSPKLTDYIKSVSQLLFAWIKSHKVIVIIATIILVGLVIAGALVFDRQPKNLTDDEVVITVNKQLGISGDSNPAILSVVDKDRVNQPFLSDSENGDKVLLYYKSGKSVLFRPSTNAVIKQGTFTPPEAKIFIRKGTNNQSKTDEAVSKLSAISGVVMSSQDESPKKDYKGVKVIDVSDRYNGKAQEVANLYGATLERIPQGETLPDADILVIVGE